MEWTPCSTPEVSDTLRWREPLWAKPNKPRGPRDKIGEQLVTAYLLAIDETAELRVIEVKRLSLIEGAKDEASTVKKDDLIRRRISSIQMGDCHKLLQEG